MSASLEPGDLEPGGYTVVLIFNAEAPVRVILDLPDAPEPKVFLHGSRGIALVPAGSSTEPGDYKVRVVSGSGTSSLCVSVRQRNFPTEHLAVSSSLASLRDPGLFEEDHHHTAGARAASDERPLWEGNFLMPVEGPITSGFGLVRFVNGVPSGHHSGIDIAAPRGTPVIAANSGVTVMARELNVSGNTIIIDHGLNVFSAYSHLDEILVERGDVVKKGRVIGRAGSTGFSTGSHLHWTVSVGPVFVDPLLAVKEGFVVPWPLLD
jgi:murein DD-endopeptidase MepM/ murein hydrolase activator NlpD